MKIGCSKEYKICEVIHIPFKDSVFNLCLIDSETGKEITKIKNIEDMEIVDEGANAENQKSCKFDAATEITFSPNNPMSIKEFNKIIGVDLSDKPAYDIQFKKFVQARKHKKRRINKKWLKRYGVKTVLVDVKGWMLKHCTDGTVEFIKGE